jgi:hypothetical protein
MSTLHRCLREDGSERRWWETVEEAAAYRETDWRYFGDRITLCGRCGMFHCTPEVLLPFKPWETLVENVRVN